MFGTTFYLRPNIQNNKTCKIIISKWSEINKEHIFRLGQSKDNIFYLNINNYITKS